MFKDSTKDDLTAEMHYLISFSGGKDSVATWLYVTKELGFKNVVCVFADTSHESKVTYDYVTMLRDDYGCPIVHVSGSDKQLSEDYEHKPLTFAKLANHKHRFPSPTKRFCTTHLKMYPLRSYLEALQGLEPSWPYFSDTEPIKIDGDICMVSGVRADESPKRANMVDFAWDTFMRTCRWLPIHKWTAKEVFDLHDKHGIPPNPLYKSGCSRVGCFPCIMAKKPELRAIALRDPEAFDDLAKMELEATPEDRERGQMSFFSHGTIPDRLCSHVDGKTNKPYPDAHDVRRWALGQDPVNEDVQEFDFEYDDAGDIEAQSCSSVYGLCE